ncbi:MAG: hypothetical protein AB1896_18635 [Thermodesulfobacteriota bacterium]
MKKGCVIAAAVGGGLALFAGIIILIVVLVFTLTGGAADEANDFLAKIGQGRMAEAYRQTAPEFQNAQSEGCFKQAVTTLGLTDYQSASWTSRSIDTAKATLEGSVTTKSGGKVPLKMVLVKVNDQWRVLALEGERPGASVTSLAPIAPGKVPSPEALGQLTLDTLEAFNQAVRAKDFTVFHSGIAKLWQDQITPAQLKEAFQAFIDNEAVLGPLKDLAMVFNPAPAIDDRGVLVLSGHYPTKPYRTEFKLDFYFEDCQWKLVGLSLNLAQE